MTTSPNPAKRCETCAFGVTLLEQYRCSKPLSGNKTIGWEEYLIDLCPIDRTPLTGDQNWGYGCTSLPKDESCRTCANLVVKNEVRCQLTNVPVNKLPTDWCGQWKPKGSF